MNLNAAKDQYCANIVSFALNTSPPFGCYLAPFQRLKFDHFALAGNQGEVVLRQFENLA